MLFYPDPYDSEDIRVWKAVNFRNHNQPWRAFVGLIGWHESPFRAIGRIFALADDVVFGDAIVTHPATTERLLKKYHPHSRDTIAAFLWWWLVVDKGKVDAERRYRP